MSDPIPTTFRRHRTLLLVSAGIVWLLVLLVLLAWWLLPRWAPNFVIRYAPMPDMVFRAAIEGDGSEEDACRRLVAMGTRAAMTMVAYLHDSDEETANMALWVLGEMTDPQTTEAVIAVLADPRESTLSIAMNTLGKIGDVRAIPHLLPFLSHENMASQAASALQDLPDTAVADALRPLMIQRREVAVLVALRYNSDPRVPAWLDAEMRIDAPVIPDHAYALTWQETAADALGEISHAAGSDLLVKAMADGSPVVRKRGAQGLEFVFRRPLSEVERAAILALLSDADSNVVEAAARVCNNHGLETAVPALLQLFTSPEPAIRKAATYGFGVGLFDEQATIKLSAVATDPDEEIRIAAVKTLCNIAVKTKRGDSHLKQALLQALNDSSPNVRKEALRGLLPLGRPSATRGLLNALDDPDSGVREVAFDLLSHSNPIMNDEQKNEWRARRAKIESTKP